MYEIFIHVSGSPAPPVTRQPDACPSDQFKCRQSGLCIAKRWKCDKVSDCDDSSDEEGCGKSTFVSIITIVSNYRIISQ